VTGWRVEVFDELASTSADCVARAEAGAPAGLVIMAARQSAGRGSRGRTWQTAPGNLAMSVLVRPDWPLAQAGFLSLLAGVAVAEALAAQGAPGVMLKWPNDVMLGGAKLGGILIDAAPRGDRLGWAVIGIGLNLAAAPDLPGRMTTCLTSHGIFVAAHDMAQAILTRLDHWLSASPAAIRAAWLALAHPAGTVMEVAAFGATRHGLFAGLSAEGELLLQTADGHERFNTGEIMLSAV
jgi:BirA family biotin operon repressor/biotin-[acetyl-CoA-carboxylase] ligase